MDSVLTVSGISHRFGAHQALTAVDLSVGAGRIYALLGPNGAGKTTLVRAISSRLKPDTGTVHIAGKQLGVDIRRPTTLGIVPQQIALYPYLTARENLVCFGALMGVPPKVARRRADAFLERTGLADRARSRLSTLSGGMQRRINIGAALMHQPKLVVLDEPTVGVDLHAREAVHEILTDLRAEGLGILITTHDMDQAATLSDTVGIINRGVLALEGSADTLIADAFDGGKELVVEVEGPLSGTQVAVLEGQGLKAVRGQRLWSGSVPGDFDDAPAMLQMFARHDIGLASFNVRAPSLGSVFFKVAGREIDD